MGKNKLQKKLKKGVLAFFFLQGDVLLTVQKY